MSDESQPAPPGLSGSVRRLLATLLATVRNRVDLLAVELREEYERLLGALLLAAGVVVCALLTLVLLTFSILLAVGEEHRPAAAALITAVYLVATVSLSWRLRARLKNWSPFSATRAELQKDQACLTGSKSNP
jgi:uncharacterized membrane protein YqjE